MRHRLPHSMSAVLAGALLFMYLPDIAGASPQPNILFIFSDDHATHAISAYGSRINQTPIQGKSFWPIAQGRTPADWRKDMYYQFFENGYGIGPHEGVRNHRYKLIHFQYGDQGWELFDLKTDPNELNNLHESTEHQPLVKELKTRLAEFRRQYQVPDDE